MEENKDFYIVNLAKDSLEYAIEDADNSTIKGWNFEGIKNLYRTAIQLFSFYKPKEVDKVNSVYSDYLSKHQPNDINYPGMKGSQGEW